MRGSIGAAFLLLSSLCRADVEPIRTGHNLTMTTAVFQRGECTIGLQTVACGILDPLSIGTSPWMWSDYRMANVAVRWSPSEINDEKRWALQAIYFKTTSPKREPAGMTSDGTIPPRSGQDYQMEAAWFEIARSQRFAPHFQLHGNLHLNYYFDQTMPFSLRRPSLKKDPWQINLSSLMEIELVGGFYLLAEIGLLDLNETYPHLHTGASLGYSRGRFDVHVGFSMTSTFYALFHPVERVDYQQTLRTSQWNGYNSDLDPNLVRQDFAIHPEFSLQYFF